MSLWISRCGAFCRLSNRARILPDGLGAAPGPVQGWNHSPVSEWLWDFLIARMFSCCDVWVLTCDLACVVKGDVILSAAAVQLLLLFQQGQAHQMQHLYTQVVCFRAL